MNIIKLENQIIYKICDDFVNKYGKYYAINIVKEIMSTQN